MAKRSRGKFFAVFAVFHSIANVFPRIMDLSIANVSLQACYHESSPANGNFVPYLQKFSHLKVLLYMVYVIGSEQAGFYNT